MIKRTIFAVSFLGISATSAFAQSADRVDPATGNYVPVRDTFSADDPTADQANPNRLSNRVGQRMQSGGARGKGPNTQPAPPSVSSQTAALTNNPQSQAPAPPLLSMSGMAMYGETDSPPVDPFAKPDWWPK